MSSKVVALQTTWENGPPSSVQLHCNENKRICDEPIRKNIQLVQSSNGGDTNTAEQYRTKSSLME